MLKSKPILLSVSVLLAASLACVLPATASTPDPNLIGTSIAQTVIAGFNQTALVVVPIVMISGTPSPTFIPFTVTNCAFLLCGKRNL